MFNLTENTAVITLFTVIHRCEDMVILINVFAGEHIFILLSLILG